LGRELVARVEERKKVKERKRKRNCFLCCLSVSQIFRYATTAHIAINSALLNQPIVPPYPAAAAAADMQTGRSCKERVQI
jgi:hypothetical protein